MTLYRPFRWTLTAENLVFPLALEQDSRGPARPSPIVSPRLGRLLCHRAQVPWRAGRPRERSPGKWQRFPGGFLVKPRELWPLFLPRFKKASLKGGRALAGFEVTAWGCPTSPTRLSVWRQAWDTAFISFFELQHRCKALYEGWGQGVLTSESAVASLPVGGVWVKGPGGGGAVGRGGAGLRGLGDAQGQLPHHCPQDWPAPSHSRPSPVSPSTERLWVLVVGQSGPLEGVGLQETQ